MPSRQDYENRLREDTRHALAPHFQGLQAELQALRDSIAASVVQLEQKVAALETLDVPAAGETIREALEGAARGAAQEKESLAQFALAMRRRETQEEILSLLLDGVSRYAPRAVLFVLRSEQFVGWASRGYPEETATAIMSQPFPESDSPALTKALEVDDVLAIGDISAESRVFALLREEQQGPWHAFPMKALRRPVAVLLVTCAEGRTCDLQPISLMMHLTGLCIENVALKILQEMKASSVPDRIEPVVPVAATAARAVSEPAEAEAAPAPEAAPRPEPVREPEPVAEVPTVTPAAEEAPEQITAVAAAVEMAPAEPAAEASPIGAPAPVEAVAQVTQQPEQALAAETVQPHAEVPPAALAAPKPAAPREGGKLSEEERLHSDAKRFARLLVSEIKLYNEQRVLEGRANRDLYVRLKRDIDRSREMYEKRVSPVVSRKMDYFHDELIRILGENDPVTLGSDYPGSRVEN